MTNENIATDKQIAEDFVVSEICYGLRNLLTGDEEQTRIGDYSAEEFADPAVGHEILATARKGQYDEAYAMAIRYWSKNLQWPIEKAMQCWLKYEWLPDQFLPEREATDAETSEEAEDEYDWLSVDGPQLYHKILARDYTIDEYGNLIWEKEVNNNEQRTLEEKS